MEYYVKLINRENLSTNKANFNKWLYNTTDKHIVCFDKKGYITYTDKSKIAYIKLKHR